MTDKSVDQLVDHLFRRQAGLITARLVRAFGAHHLGLVEDVVQHALMQALHVWPYKGVPQNPSAWLWTTARNKALDTLRRDTRFRELQPDIENTLAGYSAPEEEDNRLPREIADEQLALIFGCCDPALAQTTQVALTLKSVCGFGVSEIARAFLTKETTIAQRLTRAKRSIADLNLAFAIPGPDQIPDRLATVLETLYLVFNEGYSAAKGEETIRRDIAEEAIRLSLLLLTNPLTKRPEVHALIALMQFHAARLTARTSADGDLLLLDQQDRTQWDERFIKAGRFHLGEAATGELLTRFHVEAGIAAAHATSPDLASTDWPWLTDQYALLVKMTGSPVAGVNGAIARAMAGQVDYARKEITALISRHKELRSYPFAYAALGELALMQGDNASALTAFKKSLELPTTEPEKRLLQGKIEKCKMSTRTD